MRRKGTELQWWRLVISLCLLLKRIEHKFFKALMQWCFFLTVPFGILGGGRSNLFSFWCWLIPSCISLMFKRAFELGSMNPAVLPKSTNKAVTMAILCCSDKPSMLRTLGLIFLKGKAKISLLWELKAEKKEGAKKGLLATDGLCLQGLGQTWWQPWWLRAEQRSVTTLCCHSTRTWTRTGWAKSDLLSSLLCCACGDLRGFQNQTLGLLHLSMC